MAMSYNVEFALFYACVLALFSWLAFFLVPIGARVAYAAAKSLVRAHSQRDEDDHDLWWGRHHSQ